MGAEPEPETECSFRGRTRLRVGVGTARGGGVEWDDWLEGLLALKFATVLFSK